MSRPWHHAVGMNLPRVVRPEGLDALAADDPAAQRSRRDLQRVHRAMSTRSVLLRALRSLRSFPPVRAPNVLPQPLRLLELGAGDGSLMLGVARSLQGKWPPVALTLLDRLPLLTPATAAGYARVGWAVTAEVGDVFEWAAGSVPAHPSAPAPGRWDLIVANLFLHHFQDEELKALLAAIAERTEHVVVCEPRRGWLAWAGSHLVGALGANALTRADAVLSVHAGFRNHELSVLWPKAPGWHFLETAAGAFGHCFVASRAVRAGIGAH